MENVFTQLHTLQALQQGIAIAVRGGLRIDPTGHTTQAHWRN